VNERNPQYDLFLSYNRLDRKLVDPLAEALHDRGLTIFKDDWYLRPGEPWPAALERNLTESRAVAVAVGRNGLGPWQQREAAAALDLQSRMAKAQQALPVIPVLLDRGSDHQAGLAFLLQNTWVEGWDPRAEDLIAGAVQGKAPAELYDAAHPDPRTEAIYASLEPQEQEAVPGVFAALVQVGEARTDLRRRARLAELGAAGQAVARRLADERLLVTGRDWTSGDELVEVAHEALPRHWPKLQEWIDARRGALLTLRQLQADTETWIARPKSASYLWSHERVREAAAALNQLGSEVSLSDEEREFLGPVEPAAMLAELDRPETTHKRRALIGERLDALCDPRPGVGVDADGTPQIAWCTMSGGDASIEVERRFSPGTKTLRKQVEDLHIARYPVTVAQYRAFLEADDGWCDPRWWAEDLYRDPEGGSYDFGRFGNHPAVYVSWFDALAFCRWLSERLKASVRVPDEWEWQRAATGGDPANVFPWGNDWDPKSEPFRANTFESRLGTSTAVGMYPAGASPADVLDMAGTVWEWCLNKHDKPNITASRNRDFDRRVLRGGSWNNNQDNARSADRNRNNPNNRNNNIGFRVLCASHIFPVPPGRGAFGCRAGGSGPPCGSDPLPELSADQGLRAEARRERWRGLVPSARLDRAVGRIQNRGAGRSLLPRCPAPHPPRR